MKLEMNLKKVLPFCMQEKFLGGKRIISLGGKRIISTPRKGDVHLVI